MAKPFKRLRNLMHINDLTSEMLAEEIGIGVDTMSRKLCGHSAWTSDQMWRIMEILGEPDANLHEVFPRNGQNEPNVRRRSKITV